MMKCPVCKLQSNDEQRFCPQCGWEFKIFISDVSDEEKKVYEQRLKLAEENWQKLKELEKAQQSDKTGNTQKKPGPSSEKSSQNIKNNSKDIAIPDLKRDPFETLEEFKARIEGGEPIPAGSAKLIKEEYNIETGKFPLKASWYGGIQEIEGMPSANDPLHVVAKRDLARAIYEAGPEFPLYIRLKAEGENVSLRGIELSTNKEVLPVKGAIDEQPREWIETETGMVFIYVPSGTFQMGDIFGDGENNEKPVHEVRLDGFYMGKYPVTQGQWEKVMESNPSKFQNGDDYPVEQVSWDDVQEYINKLMELTGGKRQFSLPTEAQWEYAARSGGKEEKFAGADETMIDAVAWYEMNSSESTHPVGQKQPNGLGLYDMSGNVWEWCQDIFDENAYDKHKKDNPVYLGEGSTRVLRGGGWYGIAADCRSANRDSDSPGNRGYYLGFRLVLSPPRSAGKQEQA